MNARALALLALIALPAVAAAQAQPAPGALRSLASGRARTTVTLLRGDDRTALWIYVDYGQPHARGRQVRGSLVPLDTVWRAGANEATTLKTDVDLTIGGVAVPRGTYSLFVRGSRAGRWELVVSRKTGEWGTQYDQKEDLARIPMREQRLEPPMQSFTVWLIPEVSTAADGRMSGLPRGILRMAWGDLELSTDWVAR